SAGAAGEATIAHHAAAKTRLLVRCFMAAPYSDRRVSSGCMRTSPKRFIKGAEGKLRNSMVIVDVCCVERRFVELDGANSSQLRLPAPASPQIECEHGRRISSRRIPRNRSLSRRSISVHYT